jgi:hypothetical protein
MSEERALELLNNIINQLSVAENSRTVIKYLLHIGMTTQELIDVFGYSKTDVEECDYEMSNEDWTGGPIFV